MEFLPFFKKMGVVSGKLTGSQGRVVQELMKIQRQYVDVDLEEVDFANPTKGDESEDEKEEEEEEEGSDNKVTEDGSENVAFAAYAPKTLKVAGAKGHPSPAVENGTLATVNPPEVTYELRLAKERPDVVKKGKLSNLQLEFVALASQRFEKFLPSGSRCGFFLGDGAGTGKGRQLAGLVLENALLGRKKHLWVSTSHDLSEDAERDLKDVGANGLKVLKLPSLASKDIEAQEGVLFTTYSTLSKGCKTGKSSKNDDDDKAGQRIFQILDWIGEDFDGCLLFDECHRAKNLMAEAGNGEPTAAGVAVFEIQRLLPKARVVYCSATAVSEPHNYAYMVRLGLWGPSTPFPRPRTFSEKKKEASFGGNVFDSEARDEMHDDDEDCEGLSPEDIAAARADDSDSDSPSLRNDENCMITIKNFVDIVKKRGVGAMELIALHLKQEGALLCRTLSYEGVDFSIVEATLTEDQRAVYDQAARLWQLLYTRSEQRLAEYAINLEAYDEKKAKPTDKVYTQREYSDNRRTAHGQFWSGHQRFFRSLITAFKVPSVIEVAESALAEGKCVVIGLQSTGEAHTKRAFDKKTMQDKIAEEEILKKKDNSDDDEDDDNNDSKEDASDSMLSAPQETLMYVVGKIWENEMWELNERKRKKAAAEQRAKEYEEKGLNNNNDDDDDSLFDDDDPKNKLLLQKTKNPTEETPLKEKKIQPFNFAEIMPKGASSCASKRSAASSKKSSTKKKRRNSINSQESSIVDLCDSESDDDDDVQIVDAQKPFSKRAAKMRANWGCFGAESDVDSDLMDEEPSNKFGVQMIADIDEEIEWLQGFTDAVKALKLPNNALDEILDKLGGPYKVAEMSGRASRLVRHHSGDFVYEKRSANGVPPEEQNIFEREEFQAGRKLVAIISDAASAGISLQSDLRALNQRRRVHVTLELPWSADKTIQQMGRSHRTNQKSAPEYKLLVSPLGGERRFVAAVVKRLESLGALTQGDRRATGITKSWSCFKVDTREGASAVLDIYHHSHQLCGVTLGYLDPEDNKPLVKPPKLALKEAQALAAVCIDNPAIVGANPGGWMGDTGDVDGVAKELNLLHAAKLWLNLVGLSVDELKDTPDNKTEGVVARFLNRILGLEISRQQWLFDYFARYLELTIKAALRDGTYQQGIHSVAGRKIKFLDARPLRLKTPADTPVQVQQIAVDKGLHYKDAVAKLKEASGGDQQQRKNSGTTTTNNRPKGRQRNGIALLNEVKYKDNEPMFGERDGFRLGNGGAVVLIIEVGDASLRGLSVKSDKFTIFYPFRLPDYDKTFRTIDCTYSTVLTPKEAQRPWEKGFNSRTVAKTDFILTGPMIYLWPEILQAQYHLNAFAKHKVRVVRAEEHEDGNKTGRVTLGVYLDFKKQEQIIKRLESKKAITDDSLAGALSDEKSRADMNFKIARARKGAETRKEKRAAS